MGSCHELLAERPVSFGDRYRRAALVFFVWNMVVTTRRAGYLISESRVPRRYLVLGLVIGLGIIYYTRR